MKTIIIELKSINVALILQNQFDMQDCNSIGTAIFKSNKANFINDFPLSTGINELIPNGKDGLRCWKLFKRNKSIFEVPVGWNEVQWDHHEGGLTTRVQGVGG